MDVRADQFASYKLLASEFEKRGYSMTESVENDTLYVSFTSPTGKVWRTAAAKIGYPFNSRRVRDYSRNKETAHIFVDEHGMSSPGTYYLHHTDNVDAAIDTMLGKYQKLIVKPSDSSLSKGLSVNLTTKDAVQQAVSVAREVSSSVLIQEQVVGEEIRFVALQGKIVAALLRQTPQVVGDGVSTVAHLISLENEARKTLKFPFITYPLLDDLLIPSELIESDLVLQKGEVLELSGATMIKSGCSIYNILDQIDATYVKQVERIAIELAAGFIVIDVFVRDYSTPLTQDNYWFIEFNTAPVLKLFYGCRDGNMFDIVPLLAQAIDHHLHNDR